MFDFNSIINGCNVRGVVQASALAPRTVMRLVQAAEKERFQLLKQLEAGAALSQSQLERLRQLGEAALPQGLRPGLLPASQVRQSPPSAELKRTDARASAPRIAASKKKRIPQ